MLPIGKVAICKDIDLAYSGSSQNQNTFGSTVVKQIPKENTIKTTLPIGYKNEI